MRRWWAALVLVGGLWLGIAFPAGADNGPHGGYTPTTDACAGCHRTHTAAMPTLLRQTVPGLCLSCHGATAAGADTDVEDGVYLERDARTESPAEGVPNRGLKAGGFVNAVMDTDLDGVAVSAAVTSTHVVDGVGTAWGNGALGSGPGKAGFALSCTSCHDPHGGGAYRSLRPIPTDSGAGTPVSVPDETPKMYTVSQSTGAYVGEPYNSVGRTLSQWCAQCHTRYLAGAGSGHTASGDPFFAYRHNTLAAPCVTCHVAHGTSARMGPASGGVPWPDGSLTPNGDARSSLLRGDQRAVCASCHVKNGEVTGACDTCHGAPPNTGAHATHASPDAVGYGLVGAFHTAANYAFGCGECHPLDVSKHQDGVVEVDLSPQGAPATALKSRNAPTASFNGDTCGGVYCHSGRTITSGPVGDPLVDPATNQYLLDAYGNLVYDPYTVTITRNYKTTPSWFGGTVSGTCTDCHAFPTTTAYPDVQAGVGDSHQWIDDWGYGDLHAWNMGFEPIPCRTCHYGEIAVAGTWSRTNDITSYAPVPLAERTRHVNGTTDVQFDTVDPVVYTTSGGTVVYTLDKAKYDPATKSCTNVACHLKQWYVVWGTPYRWWTNECDLCHRYGAIPPPPPPPGTTQTQSLLGSLAVAPSTVSVHDPKTLQQQTCASCHQR